MSHNEEWRHGAVAAWKYVISVTSEWKEFIPLEMTTVQEFVEDSF